MPSTSSTIAFLADYRNFIMHNVISVPAALPYGLPSGEGRYKLKDINVNLKLLEASIEPDDISAFLVNPIPDNENTYALPAINGKYMLTSEMNGCQFIAYGPDRHSVTVEHNNFITTPARYAERRNAILNGGHAYLFHIHADTVHNVPNNTYRIDSGLEIVGRYRSEIGWQFMVRDALIAPHGTLYGPF